MRTSRHGAPIAATWGRFANATRVAFVPCCHARDSESAASAIADIEPEAFDAALTEAKAEGNLSRANVARKAREAAGDTPWQKVVDPSLSLIRTTPDPSARAGGRLAGDVGGRT